MTFTELIAAVAQDSGLPKSVVSRVLRSFIETTRQSLMSGGRVRLREFGQLYMVLSKRVVFGTPREQRVIRFKESRYGKVRRSSR